MHFTAMKYVLSFLLILLLASCGSPVGRAIGGLGNQVKQCCASLSLNKKPANSIPTHEGASTETDVSIFEIEAKLIHTW
ncbi:MAG: hypothetical protein ABI581_08385 [Sediminibacterium sp.]